MSRDFKVIEGGGGEPPDYDAPQAIAVFKEMVVEMLRSMARGDDRGGRVTRNLLELLRLLQRTRADPRRLIDEAITDLHASIAPTGDEDIIERDLERVVVASLQVAAESCCTDNAAQGRVGQRRRTLEMRINMMMEERAARRPKPPTKKQLAEDKAARITFEKPLKKKIDPPKRNPPKKRKKPWSSRDSRSYLDPKSDE